MDDSEAISALMIQWFQSPLGQLVLESEYAAAQPIVERMFGYHILQIGGSEEHLLINESPIGHKIIFSEEYRPGGLNTVADIEQLPLANDSVDAVVMHHGLDFTDDSHQLLREVTRVLRPGGQLLIIGFNPISQWGLMRLFRRKLALPWRGRFISRHRLMDWLRLLDLHVDQSLSCLHFPPLNFASLLDKAKKLEGFGTKLGSPFGGVYLISCVKQVAPITPILPKWKPLRTQRGVVPVGENFRSKLH